MIEIIYPLSAGVLLIVLFTGMFSFLQDYRRKKVRALEEIEEQKNYFEQVVLAQDEELFSLLADLQEVVFPYIEEETDLQAVLQNTVERLQDILQA